MPGLDATGRGFRAPVFSPGGQVKALLLFACLLLLPAPYARPARAECPDLVSCTVLQDYPGGREEVGVIRAPTCWRLGKGCRPWHCAGAPATDRDYWTGQCIARVPACTPERRCQARFPGPLGND